MRRGEGDAALTTVPRAFGHSFASSKWHYPKGVDVVVNGDAVERKESGDPDLFWFVNADGAKSGDKVCVELSAKA